MKETSAQDPLPFDEPPPATEEAKKAAPESDSEANPKSEGEQSSEGKPGEDGKEESKEKKEEEDKTAPPPHGDKTPWQVFTETLRTEFKASKEWNDSTKQLAAGYQEFTQNENLQKAREAYEKSTGAVAGGAGKAIKKTASAVGQTAAWTWDTNVVKGIRKGANVVGTGLEKATRPVRETEAFKSVKETIDDGSSSRYGGWSEKEERKKRREARVAKETAKNGGRSTEPSVEDPEYVLN